MKNYDAWKINPDDFYRRLPKSDEDGRMIYASTGCAAENIRIAADYYGFEAHTEYNPILENSSEEYILKMTLKKNEGNYNFFRFWLSKKGISA